MIGWLIFGLYVLVWFVSSALLSRSVPRIHKYCHQEARNGYAPKWSSSGDCFQYDRAGCWRADPDRVPTPSEFAQAVGLCLWWPLVLPLLALYRVASRPPTIPRDLDAEIERLERENGITP